MTLSVSHIIAEEFVPTLLYRYHTTAGISWSPPTTLKWKEMVGFTTFLHFIEVCDHLFLHSLDSLQHLDSFFFQRFCSRFAAVLLIALPNFSCWTRGLTFHSIILGYRGPCDCKANPNQHSTITS